MKLLQLENGDIVNLENVVRLGIAQHPYMIFVNGDEIAITMSDFERIEELTMFYKS